MKKIEAKIIMMEEVESRLLSKERASYLGDTIEHFLNDIPEVFLTPNNLRIYAEYLSNAFHMGERYKEINR